MNEQQISEKFCQWVIAVGQKYGRGPVGFGSAQNVISGDVVTVLWLEEDETKCLGFFRTSYKGQGAFRADEDLYDSPRPVTSLPILIGAAFKSVTRQEAVILATKRPRVHGNN